MDAELGMRLTGGGSRAGASDELQLCDEWTHNPALAMARPDRLCRLALATATRVEPRPPGDAARTARTTAGANSGIGMAGGATSPKT